MPGHRPGRTSIAAQMACVPVRNTRVAAVAGEDTETITVPLTRRWWMRPLSHFLRLPVARSYRLDGLGLEVWQAIDGQSTIGALVEGFAARHRLSYHEARAAVMGFLRLLITRGLIVVVGLDMTPEPELVI